MMVRSPVPSLTLQTESLSEPGTGSRVRIWATTIPSHAPEIFCTPSTSRPSMVSRSVNSSGDQLKSTYCLSQLSVTFIVINPQILSTTGNQLLGHHNPIDLRV